MPIHCTQPATTAPPRPPACSRLLSVAAATQLLPCAPLQQAASASESSFSHLRSCDQLDCEVPLPQWDDSTMAEMELSNDLCMALVEDLPLIA